MTPSPRALLHLAPTFDDVHCFTAGVTSVLNSFVRDGTLFGTPNRQDGGTKASPPSAPISPMTPLATFRRRRASSSVKTSPTLPHAVLSSSAASASASPKESPSLSGKSGGGSIDPPHTRRCVSDGGSGVSITQQQPPAPPQHRRRPSLSFLKKGASTIGGSLRNLHKEVRGGSDVAPMSPLGSLPPSRCCGNKGDDGVSVSVTFENVPYILSTFMNWWEMILCTFSCEWFS